MLAMDRSAGSNASPRGSRSARSRTAQLRSVILNLLRHRFVFRMNNPEDARAEIGVMLSAYADAHRGTREAREATRFQPDMLVNLDVFYALCSWVAGGRRADAFVGRTIRPREDPDLIAHHERAQRERGAFVLERLPNLVAPNCWVRRSAVVGVDTAEETTAARVPVDAAETSASARGARGRGSVHSRAVRLETRTKQRSPIVASVRATPPPLRRRTPGSPHRHRRPNRARSLAFDASASTTNRSTRLGPELATRAR